LAVRPARPPLNRIPGPEDTQDLTELDQFADVVGIDATPEPPAPLPPHTTGFTTSRPGRWHVDRARKGRNQR
jgi:hypothetical protein